jgi:hypothetical protein
MYNLSYLHPKWERITKVANLASFDTCICLKSYFSAKTYFNFEEHMQILKNANFITCANLKVVIFQETLEFKKTIACSYGRQQY